MGQRLKQKKEKNTAPAAPIVYTAEQQAFLDAAGAGLDVMVDACIGSGKTTAIQAACGICARQGRSVLYLTYNRRLLEEARRRIDSCSADVHTFHSYGGTVLVREGIPASSEREVPSAFVSRVTDLPRYYDTVIVDEYQDLSEELGQMLWHIARLTWGRYGRVPQFLIVGDRDQKITDSTRLDAPAFVEDLLGFVSSLHGRPFRRMEFTVCFRLSPALAADIGQAWSKSIEGASRDCSAEWMTPSNCALTLSRYRPEEILVLGSNSSFGNRVKLQNWLEERWPEKFNKNTVYSSIQDQDGDRRSLDTSRCAIFTTYDSAKGLERRVSVICDFTQGYLNARLKHPISRKVLKNLFLVAASRGRERNIFVRDTWGVCLDFEDIGQISGEPDVDMRPAFMSSLFDFQYREDVDACLALTETERLQEPGEIIEANTMSGQIDLSPCVGIYAQSAYFEGYSIDSAVAAMENAHAARRASLNLPPYRTGWAPWRKILYLTAVDTGQERYFQQVHRTYMTPESVSALKVRLRTRLAPDAPVELRCSVFCRDCLDTETGRTVGMKQLLGRMDTVLDGIPWELKFVSSLRAEHVLQCALYGVCCGSCEGILWNLRTDEMLRVRVRDPEGFLAAVLTCVSRHRLECREASVAADLDSGRALRRIELKTAG